MALPSTLMSLQARESKRVSSAEKEKEPIVPSVMHITSSPHKCQKHDELLIQLILCEQSTISSDTNNLELGNKDIDVAPPVLTRIGGTLHDSCMLNKCKSYKRQ